MNIKAEASSGDLTLTYAVSRASAVTHYVVLHMGSTGGGSFRLSTPAEQNFLNRSTPNLAYMIMSPSPRDLLKFTGIARWVASPCIRLLDFSGIRAASRQTARQFTRFDARESPQSLVSVSAHKSSPPKKPKFRWGTGVFSRNVFRYSSAPNEPITALDGSKRASQQAAESGNSLEKIKKFHCKGETQLNF
jgi:hypothetical protein